MLLSCTVSWAQTSHKSDLFIHLMLHIFLSVMTSGLWATKHIIEGSMQDSFAIFRVIKGLPFRRNMTPSRAPKTTRFFSLPNLQKNLSKCSVGTSGRSWRTQLLLKRQAAVAVEHIHPEYDWHTLYKANGVGTSSATDSNMTHLLFPIAI